MLTTKSAQVIKAKLQALPPNTNTCINGRLAWWVWYNQDKGLRTWHVNDTPCSFDAAVETCSTLYESLMEIDAEHPMPKGI